MNKIIPITDLQRQAGQIVTGVVDSDEPVIITQRGRPAAVLVSAARYSQIEEDLAKLDEIQRARNQRFSPATAPHQACQNDGPPRYHAEVVFSRPVEGALVIGRGRHCGFGLMIPCIEKTAGDFIRNNQLR